ncbi:hypothetical protein V5799_013748 [Amblyomma americanum]|uniref:Kelch domain-containing protein 3 n=1 Tax=Amblyomma americanum TaxID=6943 RepID=A0AAQ4E507_AMBAM
MWTARLEGGPRRVNHAAVAINGKVYSFGGYCTGERYNDPKPIDVHVLNTVSLRWTLVQTQSRPVDVPFHRYGHTVVAYGDCAYLWGGRSDREGCNVVYRFDTDAMTWSRRRAYGQVPGPRDGHSACVVGQRMYIFGGFEDLSDRFSQAVYFLDLKSMKWQYVRTKGQPPQWRDFHTASVIGRRMYVWGGRGDAQGPYHSQNEVYFNNIAFLDTVSAYWVYPHVDGDLPEARRSHSAFVHDGQLYIFGGYNGLQKTHFGDLHKYDPETSRWSLVKTQRECPCARRRQCCCIVGGRLFLFGGTSPAPNKVALQLTDAFDADDLTLLEHSDLHVLDLAPSLKTLSMLAVIDARMDISHLPQDIKWEISAMTGNSIP